MIRTTVYFVVMKEVNIDDMPHIYRPFQLFEKTNYDGWQFLCRRVERRAKI
jgi:hypothetical protein